MKIIFITSDVHWGNKPRRCSYIFDDISSSGRSSSSGCLEDESSFFTEQITLNEIPPFRGREDQLNRVPLYTVYIRYRVKMTHRSLFWCNLDIYSTRYRAEARL